MKAENSTEYTLTDAHKKLINNKSVI